MMIPTALIDLNHMFIARGGGGGSGGGDGGGGGGGAVVLLGYLPTHFVGSRLKNKLGHVVGLIVTIIITLVYAAPWFFIGGFFGFAVGIGALIGGPAGYFGWWSKVAKIGKKSKAARSAMTTAATLDPAWDKAALDARVRTIFQQYQQDWSSFNTENMRQYTSTDNWNYNYLMMLAIQQRQRRNAVQDPRILELTPIEVIDQQGVDNDAITYYLRAQANDQLIDTNTNQCLYTDNNIFEEYWRFIRSANGWVLDKIDQATANPLTSDPQAASVAAANGLHYSLDWGWLLLPQRGDLFKGGKFGKSDINNHAIGVYRNVLIELYTYIPLASNTKLTPYTVAQAALPKRYDSLIVKAKRRGAIFDRTPKGYNKLSLEWPDFNKRYTVYATNVEQVTAFELLHPVYMEKLFDLPFKISIEVVDNIVYLYSNDKKADYATMLALLKDAFEEMKL